MHFNIEKITPQMTNESTDPTKKDLTAHKFWKTQPVEGSEDNSRIEPIAQVSAKPITLPPGFTFEEFDFCSELNKVYKFLKEYYVEDLTSKFRLLYSKHHLIWHLIAPGFKKEYAVTLKHFGEIAGFVYAKEVQLVIAGKEERRAAVNFLCLNRELRKRRLAPVLISEIKCRMNVNGVSTAIFTAGIDLPFKLSTSRYYHYLIDTEFLCNVEFCTKEHIKKTEKKSKSKNLREMREDDYDQFLELYKKETEEKVIFEVMDKKVFSHNFISKPDVFKSLVLEEEGKIVSYGMFYFLNTFCIKTESEIKGAYIFLVSSDRKKEMIESMIAICEEMGIHTFNGVSNCVSEEEYRELGFLRGDGNLNFYLFNWCSGLLDQEKIYFSIP